MVMCSVTEYEIGEFLLDAVDRADLAVARFGPHPSAEFACCRIAEETGELVQAATSNSPQRTGPRADPIRQEALDSVAMIIRLLREYPNGIA